MAATTASMSPNLQSVDSPSMMAKRASGIRAANSRPRVAVGARTWRRWRTSVGDFTSGNRSVTSKRILSMVAFTCSSEKLSCMSFASKSPHSG